MRMKLSSTKAKAMQGRRGVRTEKDNFYTINEVTYLYGLLTPTTLSPTLFYFM